mmetsp:Transcript_12291/g.19054  ORF Transcript_12291/g.19054 Transcript_12291/m.19054 type:complete len:149 (+) Transcript_12291:1511-1957(+)
MYNISRPTSQDKRPSTTVKSPKAVRKLEKKLEKKSEKRKHKFMKYDRSKVSLKKEANAPNETLLEKAVAEEVAKQEYEEQQVLHWQANKSESSLHRQPAFEYKDYKFESNTYGSIHAKRKSIGQVSRRDMVNEKGKPEMKFESVNNTI